MFALGIAPSDDGLTLRELIAGIPHDAASVVGYVCIVVFVGFIIMGLRKGHDGGEAG